MSTAPHPTGLVGRFAHWNVALDHDAIPELVAISLVHDDPRNAQGAQFSLPCAVACAALDRTVGLEHMTETALHRPEVRALMARIDAAVAEDLSSGDMRRHYPECARIVIEFCEGTGFEGFCGAAQGMPSRPMSDPDPLAKFERCLAFSGVSRCSNVAPKDLLLGLGERPGSGGLDAIARILQSNRYQGAEGPP